LYLYYIDRTSKIISVEELDPEPDRWVFCISPSADKRKILFARNPNSFAREEAIELFNALKNNSSLIDNISNINLSVEKRYVFEALERLILLPSPIIEITVKSH
jgi:hypothetical protein